MRKSILIQLFAVTAMIPLTCIAETSAFGKKLETAAKSGQIKGIKGAGELNENVIGILYHSRVILLESGLTPLKKELRDKYKKNYLLTIVFNSTKSDINVKKGQALAKDPEFTKVMLKSGLYFDKATVTKDGKEISFKFNIPIDHKISSGKTGVDASPETALTIVKDSCKRSDSFWAYLKSKGVATD